MSSILNKKLLLLFLAFLIIFPIGIYILRSQESQSIDLKKNITPKPSEVQTLQQSDPQKERLEYIQTKKPLSIDDETIKFDMLTEIGESQSTIIYQSPTITIDYVRSADVFQGEILTTDIEAAKNEAVSWLKNKGFSDEGICNLPLSFYLNYDIKMELGDEAGSFDPRPNSCQ